MKQTLRFRDEKSDKFWRIETAGSELVTNWGKTGTFGRYEIKEFDSTEECRRQAAKKAAAKVKKGYKQMPEFDAVSHCYFDTDEYGLHPLTSHPVFRTYFSDDIYYDCGDEEAPFGSDEGSDTLHELAEALRKRPNMDFADFPRRIIEEIWDLTYLPPDPSQTDEALRAQAAEQINGLPGYREILQSDQIILATAFGQIKITGRLHPDLQKLAMQALERTERLNRLLWNWSKPEAPPYVAIMRRDLLRFEKETQLGKGQQLAENTELPALAKAMINYLDCRCRYLPPVLDDDEILVAYREAADRGKQEGFVPILVSAEDETLWECLVMNSDEDSEDAEELSFDAQTVAAYRKKLLQSPLPKGEEVTALLLKTRREEAEEDDRDWDGDVLGDITGGSAISRFIGYWEYGINVTLPLILAEIPVRYPWEIFAYLPFGGWNECPDTPELMSVAKYWFERHGAVPAVMTHDVLEFALPAPVKQEQAMLLAQEQYAWCPDIIDQCGGDATVGTLADSLTKSKCWYFWWD